jgi:iron-sulfur cluster repair protein YtfE (RIC family)
MAMTLPRVAHEHHERLRHHVEGLPALGELLIAGEPADIRARVTEAATFLTGTLMPHMDAAERTLYPELERMLQNRHSMSPMKREHVEIRRLVRSFAALERGIEAPRLAVGKRLAVRRVLFQLYALLQIHLAEEEAYLHIVEHGLSDEAAEVVAAALDHPIAPESPLTSR